MKNCCLLFYLLILGLLLFGKIGANECGISPSLERYAIYNPSRVISGEYSQEGDWPWIVQILIIENEGASIGVCTGTVLSNEWILTAAHCALSDDKNRYFEVHYGSVNALKMHGTIANETFIFSHFIQNIVNMTNDIALIKLIKPLEFNEKVSPICLDKNVTSFKGEILVGAGFGNVLKQILTNETELNLDKPDVIEYEKDSHDRLRESPMANIGECPLEHEGAMDRTICIGGINTGPLEGDSGGPLMAIRDGKWIQIGVTSLGGLMNVDLLSAISMAIYTDVNYYCDWIEKVTNETVKC